LRLPPLVRNTCLAGAIFALSRVGTYLVFGAFDLSRDEVLANFDAIILRSGHLLASLPEEWRPFADALNLDFMFPVPGHVTWVSSYLPVNAALRAAVSAIG